MKQTLCLIAALLTLTLLPASAADVKTFPAKDPVIKYEVPAKWTGEVDPADDNLSINSDDERISVTFGEIPAEATMESFEGMVPEMLKEFKDTKLVEAAKEQTSDGLTGYATTYAGMVEDSPVMIMIVLFKAGKDRSILGNFILENPATLSKEQNEKFATFMKSLQGITK